MDHSGAGEVIISVSNRQKSTHLVYPAGLTAQFQTRASLALDTFTATSPSTFMNSKTLWPQSPWRNRDSRPEP